MKKIIILILLLFVISGCQALKNLTRDMIEDTVLYQAISEPGQYYMLVHSHAGPGYQLQLIVNNEYQYLNISENPAKSLTAIMPKSLDELQEGDIIVVKTESRNRIQAIQILKK